MFFFYSLKKTNKLRQSAKKWNLVKYMCYLSILKMLFYTVIFTFSLRMLKAHQMFIFCLFNLIKILFRNKMKTTRE